MALDRTAQESGEGVAPSEKKSKEPKKRLKAQDTGKQGQKAQTRKKAVQEL